MTPHQSQSELENKSSKDQDKAYFSFMLLKGMFVLVFLLLLVASVYCRLEHHNQESIVNKSIQERRRPNSKQNKKISKNQTANSKSENQNKDNQIDSQKLLELITQLIKEENKKTIDQFNLLKSQLEELIKVEIKNSISKAFPSAAQSISNPKPNKKPTSQKAKKQIEKKILPKLNNLEQSSNKIIKQINLATLKLQEIHTLSKSTDLMEQIENLAIQFKKVNFMIEEIQSQDGEQNDEDSEGEDIWKVDKNTKTLNSSIINEKNNRFSQTHLVVDLNSYVEPIEKSRKLYSLDLSCLFESEFKTCENIPIQAFINSVQNPHRNYQLIGDVLAKHQSKIDHLYLSMNFLTSSTFSQIIDVLEKKQKINTKDITVVDLSYNHIESLTFKEEKSSNNIISQKFSNLRQLILKQNTQLPFSELFEFSQQKMTVLSQLFVSIESLFTSDHKMYQQFAKNIRQNWHKFNEIIVYSKNKTLYDLIHEPFQKAMRKKLQNHKKYIIIVWKK